jgi:hypothetical protein
MSDSWNSHVSATGRLARVEGGRNVQKLVRFSATTEYPALAERAACYGLAATAFLHIAGLYFVPPADAPTRFRPAARSAARDRALAAELEPIRRQLVGVARNVNQMTVATHQTGRLGPEPQLTALAEHAHQVLARLDTALTLLDPDAPAWPGAADLLNAAGR